MAEIILGQMSAEPKSLARRYNDVPDAGNIVLRTDECAIILSQESRRFSPGSYWQARQLEGKAPFPGVQLVGYGNLEGTLAAIRDQVPPETEVVAMKQ